MKELFNIQQELVAPKGNFNSFGKYKYRSCEDILEAVKPLLKKYNCLLTLSDNAVLVGESVFIEATATLKSEEEEHSVQALAKHPTSQAGMSDSQMTGAASSYARKYALNGLFAIDDEKDDDSKDNTKPSVAPPKAQEETKVCSAHDEPVPIKYAVSKSTNKGYWGHRSEDGSKICFGSGYTT